MKRPRRRHTPEFKAQVALASLQHNNAVHLCADRYGVHPNLVRAWQSRLLASAALLFERKCAARGRMRRGAEAKADAAVAAAAFAQHRPGSAPPAL